MTIRPASRVKKIIKCKHIATKFLGDIISTHSERYKCLTCDKVFTIKIYGGF